MIFSESQFQASRLYSYLETRGLIGGGIGHSAIGSSPQPTGRLAGAAQQLAKESEAEIKLLTSIVFSASTNQRPVLCSDSLTVASHLLRSAKVKFLALSSLALPELVLEAMSAIPSEAG
jgi:hypothetical protein